MIIEINQSNKIEQTNKDSIVGLANEATFTVLIKRKTKRKLQDEFRRQGRPRLFVYRTFIASVVLLLKHARLRNILKIIIDQEYFGQDRILKSMFLEMWSRFLQKFQKFLLKELAENQKSIMFAI